MVNTHSFRPYPEKCFAPNGGNCELSAQPAPRRNLLLAALPPAEYARLLPFLEPVCLPLGWSIHSAGDREKHLYFLTAGVVSRHYVMESGASAEFAVTGREGVIGVATFLGGSSTPSHATVLGAGHAYRLRASQVRHEIERGGPLVDLLLRYTQALIAQMIQAAACNRHHPIGRQLCRSILSILDRSPSNELTLTHERMADMLGVRREGITEAAGKLQEAGLIHYGRGHITVLDRARLEAQACECYWTVKREYERLLPNCVEPESFPCEALAALES